MLAPQGHTDETPSERSKDAYPQLRQAQLSVLQLNRTALIYPIDVGDDGKTVYTPPSSRHGDVHPRNKTEFGRRLALAWADMEGALPNGVVGQGPGVPSSSVEQGGGAVLLTFAPGEANGGLFLRPTADCFTFGRAGPGNATAAFCCQNNSTDPRGPHGFPFEVGVAGGEWVLAVANVLEGGGGVRLTPLAAGAGALTGRVRYAWDAWPLCVLSNAQGLPLPPYEK